MSSNIFALLDDDCELVSIQERTKYAASNPTKKSSISKLSKPITRDGPTKAQNISDRLSAKFKKKQRKLVLRNKAKH